MESELVDPLSQLIATDRLSAGDVLDVERQDDHLVFYRQGRKTRAESAKFGIVTNGPFEA